MVWGANFAVRRSAIERIGEFDESIVTPHGDEEEWLERLRAAGGTIEYIAAAGLDHRRTAEDARLGRWLARPTRAARRASERHPPRAGAGPRRELRVLAGCGWHTVRRACPQGVIMGAHSAGRVVEALTSARDPRSEHLPVRRRRRRDRSVAPLKRRAVRWPTGADRERHGRRRRLAAPARGRSRCWCSGSTGSAAAGCPPCRRCAPTPPA